MKHSRKKKRRRKNKETKVEPKDHNVTEEKVDKSFNYEKPSNDLSKAYVAIPAEDNVSIDVDSCTHLLGDEKRKSCCTRGKNS